ncbi:hypothetical protein MNEG_2937 [Monoraphidium neglectum]|uniref:AtC3H23-like CCCH zinc finger domain-containing protein n=1 Tax=Monoraphidium neglectum TaxID=145388 RepID=A0A0D2K3H3_9CHLO|nr:hypothetical protein MNEG_2937 [Monoraphidium neglectum]KIZ05023.1 hypothetical protein MNEG_2937 [Monoraphidium neglectum]|eukprot:XP_013904042.1 hypothetical protein MNEG_2937 [Monoraphidium neglectum]
MSVRNLSDEFMIWRYKVEFCSRKDNHDWATCPYAHDKEKAKRRDPACFNYASLPCPNTMQEYWLHPDRFKTQMCKNGSSCTRPLCFFAHNGMFRFPAAPGSPQSASASLQQQQQQQQQQATQLRAYLEEQQLLVQLQCASLEQEQVRLGLLLGQLQTSAAVPSAQPLDAAPPSPVSVQTSALSGSSSICPGVGGDLNALLLQQVPMAAVNNEPLQLYPVSAALATAIAGGGALNGAAAWPVASAQQQIGVLPLAFDAGALRPLF